MLFVETIYDLYAIYPSEFFELHPDLRGGNYGEYGHDYLKAMITESHKRDIEIHAWTHVFRTRKHAKVVIEHPEWLIETIDGQTDVTYYGSFLDSTNPGVKDYLLSIIDEVLSNYNFDGYQYDYIRYPGSFESPTGEATISGFTEHAMESFKVQYGYTGDVRQLTNNPTISDQWMSLNKMRLLK